MPPYFNVVRHICCRSNISYSATNRNFLQRPTSLRWNQLAYCSYSSATRGIRRLLSSHVDAKRGTKGDNIILMGSPGCGKTTVGRVLGARLGRPVIDIDDHLLEPYWKMSVASKLDEVGSNGFVQAEGEALLTFAATNSIVSLTGSNPMYQDGIDHISTTGTIVFLDVHMDDILERLERMKVNRIVGQNDGTSMADILKYRQQFYDRCYDIRITCERNEAPEQVADKLLTYLEQTNQRQSYISTRGYGGQKEHTTEPKTTFNDAILQGLAPDSGLFVPSTFIPKINPGELERLVGLNYNEKALKILERWVFHTDVKPQSLKQFIDKAYSAEAFESEHVFPVKRLANKNREQYLLELFHGPTASFKDAALQLLPQFFNHARKLKGENQKYTILVATSGDTGGAVLNGFVRHCDNAGIGVLVFYPENGISEIQKQQMVSLSKNNAKVIGVTGADFDMCQTAVKRALNDESLSSSLQENYNLKLSAANSISWGRLLPQMVYHVTSYLGLVENGSIQIGDEVDLCIPTGNFGNILAAFYAKNMGIPYKRLICASNTNNILTDFINTGTYYLRNRTLQTTASPAIDILVSSNLERLLFEISERDSDLVRQLYEDLKNHGHFTVPDKIHKLLQETFVADWCDETQCKDTIIRCLDENDYLLDPHTAVAKTVADRQTDTRPILIAATAHPGKFAHDMLKFLDKFDTSMSNTHMLQTLEKVASFPVVHKQLQDCVEISGNEHHVCHATYEDIVQEIKAHASTI